ncbi:MAG: PDZ domain-containing protein [Planctomycetia bacterium]|nr:PDZ domain-containing protein [Planctomycetia bacterium]
MSLRTFSGLLLLAVAGTTGVADAQQALENLEKQLAQPPVETAAAEEPGYLGIIADDRETQGRGIRLIDVLTSGPAAKAGLQTGDTITSIDGVAVKSLDDMAKVMVGRIVGEEVSFVATRGIEAVRVDVVLTRRPPPEERRFNNFGRIGDPTTEIITPNDIPPTVVKTAPQASRIVPGVMPAVPARGIPHPSAPGVPSADALPPPEVISNIPQAQRPSVAPPIAVASRLGHSGAPTTIQATPAIPPANTLRPGTPLTIDPNSPAAAALRTGLLGIRTTRVTPELQLAMNLPEPRGALVIEVRPDSPAKFAGIPIDAVIVAADAKRIDGPNDLSNLVAERGPGAEVRLSYYRYGQLYEKTVKLLAPPPVVVADVVAGDPSLAPKLAPKAVEVPGPGPGRMEPSFGLPPTTVPTAVAPPSTKPSPTTLPPIAPSTPATGPTLAPVSAPTVAKAPTSESEAAQIRKQIRDLEAQLKALEKRLPPETK